MRLRFGFDIRKATGFFIGQMEDMRIRTPKGEFPLSELIDYEIFTWTC